MRTALFSTVATIRRFTSTVPSTKLSSERAFFRPAKKPPPIPFDPVNINDPAKAYAVKLWSRLFYFCCIPAIIVCYIRTMYFGEEITRPPFKRWDFVYAAKGGYPWGDGKHSFFFNKYLNATEDGYETTDEEFEEWKKQHKRSLF